jgi:hypothetical protein
VAATVCTLGFGVWLEWLGGPQRADRVLLTCAGLSLVPLVLDLALPEPRRSADAETFSWSALRVLGKRHSLVLLAFGCLYSVAGMGVESNLSLYYQRLGVGSGSNVGMLGGCRNLGRAVGAVLLPIGVARMGRRAVLTLGVVGLAAAIGGQTLVANRSTAGLLAFSFGAANGWDDALFAVLAMEATDPRMAASTFVLFMAVTNTSLVGDALFARGVSVSGGFRAPLMFAAAVALATLVLTGPLSRPVARPELDDGPVG